MNRFTASRDMRCDSPSFDASLGVIGFSTDEGKNSILCALEDLSLTMDYVAVLRDDSDVNVQTCYQSAMLRTFSRAAMAIKRDVGSMIECTETPPSKV